MLWRWISGAAGVPTSWLAAAELISGFWPTLRLPAWLRLVCLEGPKFDAVAPGYRSLVDSGATFAYLGGQHSYHEPRHCAPIWVSAVVVMAIHVEIMSIDYGHHRSRLRCRYYYCAVGTASRGFLG